jgi:SAM-dependent methyltransferase
MKLKVAPENPVEALVMALGLAPFTILDTHVAFMRARAIMVAVRLGIFDELASGPAPASAVASRCGTDPAATAKLLNALVGSEYATFDRGVYAIGAASRRWLTRDSPQSIRDKVLFEFVEWTIVEHFEDFVRTGQPLDIHRSVGVSGDDWDLYQRGMRALSGLAAPEIVRRTPLPPAPATMLDIGGSHGFIAVSMCRKYPTLRATVLDLPEAVRYAAPILAREQMGDRVVHRAGDALKDDFGTAAWDFIYVSQLLHHFDEAANRAFVRRVADALKPNGVFAIVELLRPGSPNQTGQVGAILDLYFAVTSRSGTWSVQDMTGWQREAGLRPRRPVYLRTVPGAAEIIAVNPPA